MNMIPDHTMRQMISVTAEAMAAMESIRPMDRPEGYSGAIGRLSWVLDALLRAAVAPVAVEPVRDLEAVQ